jgi:hypothetical protein
VSDDIRPEVVEALVEATTSPGFSDEHVAELLWNATPAERRAAADVHGYLADLNLRRAVTLQQALELLKPYWRWPHGTLGAVLKTAPPDVVRQAAGWLRLGGWDELNEIS